VPLYCVLITGSISFLTYMACTTGSNMVFIWFQNITTIASLFTWCSICVASIRFHKAMQVQGIDRNMMVFRAPFQPYTAWISLFFFAVIIVFNGFYAFAPWDIESFFTAYIGIPIYFGLVLFWKVFKKTKWVKPEEADLFTGKAALDAVEWPEDKPRNWLERIWYWIA
jgi:amino acid transporter